MDVETLAVTEIAGLVARCPHLKPVISTNDKTIFTDGHIDVYHGLSQTKADWRGRVSVQVKGRTGKIAKGKPPKHPISRDDLRAYQRDSGVLFFYVLVDGRTGSTTPFYRLLSPFAIDAILREAPKRKNQISVQMNALPAKIEDFERLVALALTTRAQNASIGFDPILFEKAESFTLHAAAGINFDEPRVLAPGAADFALILNTSDGMSIHLDGEFHVLPSSFQEQTLEVSTSSGGFTYDRAVSKRINESDLEVRISEGLALSFHREGAIITSVGVHLTLERTLSGRVKALGFFTSLLDTKFMSIDGNQLPIEITESGDHDWLRRHLRYLRWLSELLEFLGVDTSLVEPDQIDEDQYRQLNVLYRAFVKGEEVTDKTATVSRVLQRVGQWHLMFLLTPGSGPGKWICVDPFSLRQRQQFLWSSEEKDRQERTPVTAYDVVENEHLGTVINSRLGSIVGAYEAISEFESTFAVANHRVLALILAADACAEREGELLAAAKCLNDWLLARDGGAPLHQINAWQITARLSGLTPEERTSIRQLKRDIVRGGAEDALQTEIACAILLENAEEFEDLVPHLGVNELEQMETWPIWKLRPNSGRQRPN